MNSGAAVFSIGIALTAFLSLTVVAYLNRHIRNLLTDLCGKKERANFWCAFSNVLLFLFPLLFVLDFRPDNELWIWGLAAELERALMGLVATVVVFGIVMVMSISRQQTSHPSTS